MTQAIAQSDLRLVGVDAPTPGSTAHRPQATRWWQYGWLRNAVQAGLLIEMTGARTEVMVVLLAHANAQREAWPAVERIAELAGLSRRSVQQALHDLSTDPRTGISAITSTRASTTYRFSDPPSPAGQSRATGSDRGAHCSAPGGALQCAGGRTPVRPNGEMNGEMNIVVEATDAEADDEFHTGLFDTHDLLARLGGLGFRGRDARRLVRRHGPAAVHSSVDKADWYIANRVTVAGREIRNPVRFIVADLLAGYAPDPRCTPPPADRRCSRAPKAPESVPTDPTAERAAQDAAMVELVLATAAPGAIAAARRRVIDAQPDWLRAKWERLPAEHAMLRSLVVAQLMGGASE